MANKYSLSYSDELKIHSIFEDKGWLIDNTNKCSLYNRFRERCQELNDEERDLFYNLSLNFRWVTLNEYIDLLSKLLVKVVKRISRCMGSTLDECSLKSDSSPKLI